jgi:nucleoside-diphosphate-sugar epimerase
VTTQEIGISHVFADYIKNIAFEKMNPLPIIGDGEQIRCFTWIEEVAQAIADYSFSDEAKNEVFNLGNPEPISMKQLALTIHKKAQELNLVFPGELKFQTVATYKNDVIVRLPDVSKAKRVLGWSANQKVEESITNCLMEAWK